MFVSAFRCFLLLVFSLSIVFAGEVVGNRNSKKYHKPACGWGQKISPSNLVMFQNVDEALAAGYVPCKVCRPSGGRAANSNQMNVTPQTKNSSKTYSTERCLARTKKGTQCSRRARAGSSYCWQHTIEASKEEFYVP
ncbi:hypothetical protein FBQ87_06190 [Sphingobacteriales bacterium CHB3]|nr:hypothetical protein [Sphingobacteriales bacterium CHB3]